MLSLVCGLGEEGGVRFVFWVVWICRHVPGMGLIGRLRVVHGLGLGLGLGLGMRSGDCGAVWGDE
jgi:hypothetical protein